METEQDRQDGGGAGAPRDKNSGGAGGGGGGGGKEPTIEEKLAAVTAERDELKDRFLRLAAEFDNWKKRSRKEQNDSEGTVREAVLKDMLEVIDNLERAVGAYGAGTGTTAAGTTAAGGGNGVVDGATILKGVSLVLRLFQQKLDRYGVKPIVARGEPFDPHQHEAVSRVETKDVPAGSVAVELQRGYRIGDRLLRPALVSVATAPRDDGAGGGAAGESA